MAYYQFLGYFVTAIINCLLSPNILTTSALYIPAPLTNSCNIVFHYIEARAEIIGPSLRYLTPDSTLRLICRVVQSTETVSYLFWYHDHRMINYDKGINITTEAGKLTLNSLF